MATGLGLDIGSTAIKAVQVAVSGDAVRITGALRIPRQVPGLDVPDEQLEAIPPDLGAELKAAGLKTRGVVGLTGRDLTVKYLATPPMPPQKIKMLMDMEVGGKEGQRSASDGADVTYDYRQLEVPSGIGGDLILLAGMAPTAHLMDVSAQLKAAGAGLTDITPSCFGLLQAYLRTQSIEPGAVAVVDVGHKLIEILIVEEQRLYFARSAPGGGERFTAALTKALKYNTRQADEFKETRAKLLPEGTPVPDKQELLVQAALREGAEHVAGAIRSSIMFCRTQVKMPKLDVSRIVLSGGGARLPGLREYIEKKLSRPVVPLDLSSALDLRSLDAESARCFDGGITDMAVPLGLAIIAADETLPHLSLMPKPLVRKQVFWRSTVYGIAAGIVLLLSAIPAIQNSSRALAQATERAALYEQQKKKAIDERKEFTKQSDEMRARAAQRDALARISAAGQTYAELFALLRAETPKDIRLNFIGPAGENAGAGFGNWSATDENSFLTATGEYDPESYPGTAFDSAWEKLREKILKVPGVKGASLEPVTDEEGAAATDKAPATGAKRFQFKLTLKGERDA